MRAADTVISADNLEYRQAWTISCTSRRAVVSIHRTMTQLWLILLLLLAVCRHCSAEAHIIHILNCPLVAGGTCPESSVRFILFTRSNPSDGVLVDVDEVPPIFNTSHPTKVLIHGYNSGMEVLFDIRDAYLANGDYNVIMLDWNKISLSPCYPTAVYNARFVGKCSAQMIQRLRGMGAEDIHLVGFSLGAHVTGFTANHLRPYKLPRITGLDPAMPLFVTVPKDGKLDATDAQFVDVMHTNAFFQGKAEQMGQVDIYMNGGVDQPGCAFESSFLSCNHHRAVAYFTESIKGDTGLWAWKCRGLLQYALGMCPPSGIPQLIGEFIDYSARGLHICKTNDRSPFALGKWWANGSDRLRYSVDREESCGILRALQIPHPTIVQLQSSKV
ncbi:lipase member H-A [Anabrus simplex]|uniref:lipase member H-A n=1 Tax=Anabrus simplex TaxID=316456 RepID=UPI0034DDC36D